jgi:dihydroflavonol-4-reductase
MKVLVTGASGFVGSHVVESLLGEGRAVRAMARDPLRHQALAARGVEVVQGDLNDPGSLERAVNGVDALYHCAAQLNLPGATVEDYMRTNVGGLRNLVEAIHRRAPNLGRFVHVSSIAAIGIRNLHVIDETEPCKPDLAYGVSKLRADEFLQEQAGRTGFPVVILRPPTVYGPGERFNFLSLCLAIRRRRFLLIGSGANRIDFCWVGNLVQAMTRAAEKGRPGEVYLVADGEPLPFAETARTIAELVGTPLWPVSLPTALAYLASVPLAAAGRLTGTPPLLYPKRVRTMSGDMVFDLAKARRELGYEPEGAFRNLARGTIEWYRTVGLLPSRT